MGFQHSSSLQQLLFSQQLLGRFNILYLNSASLAMTERLKKQIKSRKRYADVLIAAQALAGQHILITRNIKDFQDLMPSNQLQNWVDDHVN